MSCYTFHFAECKYESPSCEIYEVAVNTSLIVASVSSSTINPYAEDPNSIDL